MPFPTLPCPLQQFGKDRPSSTPGPHFQYYSHPWSPPPPPEQLQLYCCMLVCSQCTAVEQKVHFELDSTDFTAYLWFSIKTFSLLYIISILSPK